MTGRTNSWVKFQDSLQTVDHLSTIRVSKTDSISHDHRASLNKAGMVFIVTAWEAYVEDVAREAADHIAGHIDAYNNLPKRLKTIVFDGIRKNTPSWLPTDIADGQWRQLVKRIATMKTTDGAFNTPSTENVRKLFYDTLGLEDVTTSWGWQSFASPGPANRLDETIHIRGEIVHTGGKPDGLAKGWLDTYGENVSKLANRTDIAVRRHAEELTGTAMPDFSAPDTD